MKFIIKKLVKQVGISSHYLPVIKTHTILLKP